MRKFRLCTCGLGFPELNDEKKTVAIWDAGCLVAGFMAKFHLNVKRKPNNFSFVTNSVPTKWSTQLNRCTTLVAYWEKKKATTIKSTMVANYVNFTTVYTHGDPLRPYTDIYMHLRIDFFTLDLIDWFVVSIHFFRITSICCQVHQPLCEYFMEALKNIYEQFNAKVLEDQCININTK